MTTRHYAPIWSELKSKQSCEITAHKTVHARIKKALRKEKDEDLAYKFECGELKNPVRAQLQMTSEGSILRFKLVFLPVISVDTV